MTVGKELSTIKVHTTWNRQDVARSSDGRRNIQFLSAGTLGNGTNPEELVAAGWLACCIGVMGLVAGKMNVSLPADGAIDVEVDVVIANHDFSIRARRNISGINEIARTVAMFM